MEVILLHWTLLTLLSCTGADSVVAPVGPPASVPFRLTEGLPAGFPDLRTSHSAPLLLHRIDGTMKWPNLDLPPRVRESSDAFVVPVEPLPNRRNDERSLRVFRAKLPFVVNPDERVFRPEGMSLTVDGQPVPFSRLAAPAARQSTWRIVGRNLILTHATVPDEVRIAYPGARDTLSQWDPLAAGGDLVSHSRGELSLGGQTRSGIRLPAPGVAEWAVTLPKGPVRFRSHVARYRARQSLACAPMVRPSCCR